MCKERWTCLLRGWAVSSHLTMFRVARWQKSQLIKSSMFVRMCGWRLASSGQRPAGRRWMSRWSGWTGDTLLCFALHVCCGFWMSPQKPAGCWVTLQKERCFLFFHFYRRELFFCTTLSTFRGLNSLTLRQEASLPLSRLPWWWVYSRHALYSDNHMGFAFTQEAGVQAVVITRKA